MSHDKIGPHEQQLRELRKRKKGKASAALYRQKAEPPREISRKNGKAKKR
jgi:hypothetical protein